MNSFQVFFFFFKQKTAYDMRISDWSSDVCPSDLLLPDEPEAKGVLALMLYAEARRGARRSADNAYIPLAEQDTDLWNHSLIDRAEALLSAANANGPKIGKATSRERVWTDV